MRRPVAGQANGLAAVAPCNAADQAEPQSGASLVIRVFASARSGRGASIRAAVKTARRSAPAPPRARRGRDLKREQRPNRRVAPSLTRTGLPAAWHAALSSRLRTRRTSSRPLGPKIDIRPSTCWPRRTRAASRCGHGRLPAAAGLRPAVRRPTGAFPFPDVRRGSATIRARRRPQTARRCREQGHIALEKKPPSHRVAGLKPGLILAAGQEVLAGRTHERLLRRRIAGGDLGGVEIDMHLPQRGRRPDRIRSSRMSP